MRPLVYGYLRLDLVGEHVKECERRIRRFAAREGYDLGMIFHERTHGRAALDALIGELRRAQCHNVAVPDLEHLAREAVLRQAVEARLWCEADAGVLVAGDGGASREVFDGESVEAVR